jgi:hypothetical protein
VRKILTILTLIAALAAGLASATPAEAASFYNVGVKKVTFHEALDACIENLFLPCTLNAGTGSSNVLQISQQQTHTGDMVFADYKTTSIYGDSHLWLAANVGAECRGLHRLREITIRPEWKYGHGRTSILHEINDTHTSVSIPNNTRTMPTKLVAVNLPMHRLFGGDQLSSLVPDFDSLQEVYDHGEAVIAERVASGMTEVEARSQGFAVETWVAMHARAKCDLNNSGNAYYKDMPRYLPLRIEFVGAPLQPGKDHAIGDVLTTPDKVTEAHLVVLTDPTDACVLHLSGTLIANGNLSATYRFVNQFGQRSNSYTVDLAKDQPHFFSHEVAIPYAETGPSGPSLVTDTGPGTIGGLADHPSDKATGTYRIEVTSPNLLLSNVAGFSVDPCPVPPAADVPEAGQPPTADPLPLPPPPPPPGREPAGDLTLG